MVTKAQPSRPARLTREEWLERALEVLAEEGASKIRVTELARNLGVTTGSLYWHFEGRSDLVRSLAEYWARISTGVVVERIADESQSAQDRLLALLKLVIKEDLGRYDVAVRTWAAQEPEIADVVREVDQQRYQFVRGLFEEMGFRGEELEVRSRTFVAYLSLELGILARETKEERLRRVEPRLELFTRK